MEEKDYKRLLEIGKDILIHVDLDIDQFVEMKVIYGDQKKITETLKILVRMTELVCEWLPLYVKLTEDGLPDIGTSEVGDKLTYHSLSEIDSVVSPIVLLASAQTRMAMAMEKLF